LGCCSRTTTSRTHCTLASVRRSRGGHRGRIGGAQDRDEIGAEARTGTGTMVVLEGNDAAGRITVGVCVMEKKVRILTLWPVEVFLFLLLGGSRILADTWMLYTVLSSWLLIDSCYLPARVSQLAGSCSIGWLVVVSGACPHLINF
jgi:hypothetical protein